MRNAFHELLEYCPTSLKNLRANVVLLSGNVEDEFALGPDIGRTDLTGVLMRQYRNAAERVILYSLNRGLRRPKMPQTEHPVEDSRSLQSSSRVDPGALIQKMMSRSRSRLNDASLAEEIGSFVNAPAEALREIHRTLAQSKQGFVLFHYSANIQLLGDSSADLVPILEDFPALCRDRGHLVIFSGAQPHNDLERVLPTTAQKVLRLQLRGPSSREIECTLLEEEIAQRRSLVDCNALPQVVAALEHITGQPSSGLKTVVDSFFRIPSCWLDADWAKENGAAGFDVSQIDLAGLTDELARVIVGQEFAKNEVIDRLRRFSAFGRDGRGPFLRFLFVGPSGVGKTEMARIVCRGVFESDDAMLTVACTEYSQPHEVAKLLGAPPGYTGHDQPALLESHRRRFPAGLLLLDEFEKAHPDIHRFFMNVLEEGTATSPRSEGGRPVALDFTNYIVIATSNAGSKEVDLGSAPQPVRMRQQLYHGALKRVFPAELLGRFQERLVFDFLSNEQLEMIATRHAKQQMEKFIETCRQRRSPIPAFKIDSELYKHLVKLSDSMLGARDLRGKVEKVFQRVWMERYIEADPKPAVVQFLMRDAENANA